MEQVNQAERIVFGGQCTTDTSLDIRVSALEMKMFGTKSEGGIVPRIKRIMDSLRQNMPPGVQNTPPGAQNMPPGVQNTPQGAQNMPPGAQNVPPGAQNMPPGAQNVPPGVPVGSTTTLKSAVSKTEMLEQPGNAAPRDKASRERLLEQADHQIESGQTDDAKHALEQLTQQDYRNARAYYGLGSIALKNEDYAEALKNFFFAHFVQPSDPQYKIAVTQCEQLINKKLNPHYHNYNLFPNKGDIHAVVNQGVRFWALGKTDEAQACFEQALRIQPHNADAFYNLGAMADYKGDLPRALDFYKRSQYHASAQMNELSILQSGSPLSTLLGGIIRTSPNTSLQELRGTFDDANQAIADIKLRIEKGNNVPLVFVGEAQFPVCPTCRILRQKKMYPD
jgi:tetratricopeptide (TPR) repeat protein